MVNRACISSKCIASVLSVGPRLDPVYLIRYGKVSEEKEFSVEELSSCNPSYADDTCCVFLMSASTKPLLSLGGMHLPWQCWTPGWRRLWWKAALPAAGAETRWCLRPLGTPAVLCSACLRPRLWRNSRAGAAGRGPCRGGGDRRRAAGAVPGAERRRCRSPTRAGGAGAPCAAARRVAAVPSRLAPVFGHFVPWSWMCRLLLACVRLIKTGVPRRGRGDAGLRQPAPQDPVSSSNPMMSAKPAP